MQAARIVAASHVPEQFAANRPGAESFSRSQEVVSRWLHGLHRQALHRQIAWSVYLLPYLELEIVGRLFDENHAYNSAENHEMGRSVVSVYLCPSTATQPGRSGPTTGDVNGNGQFDPGDDLAYIDYGGMFGVGDPKLPLGNGTMIYERAISARDVRDGLSQTIIVAEDTGLAGGEPQHGTWADGQNIFDVTMPINRSQNNELWSDHSGGVNATFCDGAVRFLSQNIANDILFACVLVTATKSFPPMRIDG